MAREDEIPMLHSDGLAIADALTRIARKRNYTLYGFHIKNNESNPASKITYLEDAVGMEPAHMDFTNGVFNWGSWKNAFFMPRPVMLKSNGQVDYYLSENDFTKKEDGTASDVANVDYDGNAMIEWGSNGKIWLKVVPDSDDPCSASIYICDQQLDSQFHDWSFINKDNVHVDHFYTPIYNGSMDSNSKMRSISGQAISNAISGSAEVTAATKNGDNWYTEVIADRMLITYLLYLIGKSTNTQAVFGQGMTSSGETGMKAYKTGALDKMGMFFGYSDTTHAVKVFGMENFWGCQWRRTAGLVQVSGAVKYKLTRGTADGSTATDYNGDGTGYLSSAVTLADNGWQVANDFSTGIMLPTAVGGSDSTYYADYYLVNKSATCYALYGGNSDRGSYCGASFVALGDAFGSAGWNIGAALSYKPAA